MKDESILEWLSPEHHYDQRTNDWYWLMGAIVIAIAILSFYFDNFLFGIFVIIAGCTLGMLSYKETKILPIRILPKGISFGKFLYPWMSYQSFWIEDDHIHGARILMNPQSAFMPLTIIPIHEGIDLNDVRDVLLEFLEEEHIQESIVHKWFDKLLAK